MPNSFRIRTEVGKDKSIKVQLEQDFESLEILSLKILQSQIYTRVCSDYGVVVGRVTANNGYGIPNAKVSIFIPLSEDDENNSIISELYPYRTLNDLNEDGYRYNLLPYTKSHTGHQPTGTFPTREDVLINDTLIEVYDKYYKYTVKTNESGDYMIFGVPTGNQTIHIDVDLSDIGEFSLSPQDLVRVGIASENQVNGTEFRTSTNLGELPQILTINRTLEIEPLWGEPNICNLGIVRSDFDLTQEFGLTITPSAIFMGSIFSSDDKRRVRKNCRVNRKLGSMCEFTTGPGEILAIRQTINVDSNGRPVLEQYQLEDGGKCIDENGTWLIDVPMNLDFVYTNEYGERVISNDPKIGVPTKGKYRFKVKWEQPGTLSTGVKRANFLVPNVKEWGWTSSTDDPSYVDRTSNTDCKEPNKNDLNSNTYKQVKASYAFSLDWDEYGAGPFSAQMIQEAINCEDRFYDMTYNKVYSVSQLITQYRRTTSNLITGIQKRLANKQFIGIKDILNDKCEGLINTFPFNDGQYQFSILFTLFSFLLRILFPVLLAVIFVLHLVALIVCTIKEIICAIKGLICGLYEIEIFNTRPFGFLRNSCNRWRESCNKWEDKCTNFVLPLPNYTFPDCEFCNCKEPEIESYDASQIPGADSLNSLNLEDGNFSQLIEYKTPTNYICPANDQDQAYNLSPLFYSETGRMVELLNNGTIQVNAISTSLPLNEKLNLFNTKAKYFDNDDVSNPGGGVNRVKVTFNSDLNDYNTQYHYDSIVAIILESDTYLDIEQGSMMTFNSINASKDPNLTGLTLQNQFSNNAVTGTSINGTIVGDVVTTNQTVYYALPDNSGLDIPVSYVITGLTGDTQYMKFPTDLEYFQVITATTISDFLSLSESSSNNPNSLANRFVNGGIDILTVSEVIFANEIISETKEIFTPTTCFSDYSNYKIVFLLRGVDPYSTRTKCRIDLSYIYGYNTWDDTEVTPFVIYGDYKLNIPIRGTSKCLQHNDPNILSNTSSTTNLTYTGPDEFLYYDSYHFVPDPTLYIPFQSNLPSYYSIIDNLNTGGAILASYNNSPLGITIDSSNYFSKEFYIAINNFHVTEPVGPPFFGPPTVDQTNNTPINGRNRGYFNGEIVDGGTLLYMTVNSCFDNSIGTFLGTIPCSPIVTSDIYCQRYSDSLVWNFTTGPSGRQIVMRSDRLPTSSTPLDFDNNTRPLMSNTKFIITNVTDDGLVEGPGNFGDTTSNGEGTNEDAFDLYNQTPALSGLSDTFECSKLVPLSCYKVNNEGFAYVADPDDNCYYNSFVNEFLPNLPDVINENQKELIMKNGCYIFVTKPIISLPGDIVLLLEWRERVKLGFAACQNVFGHNFINNWINGTLFMFPFQSQVLFTSVDNEPTDTNGQLPPNFPYTCVCKHTIFSDLDNNSFYYRSSPYDGTEFIGRENTAGNNLDLMFPTTMIDMGPRNNYLTELTFNDNFYGYIVNKLDSTSYKDNSDLLNLFINSRMIGQGFKDAVFSIMKKILGVEDGLSQYFPRDYKNISGDYAQMGAINSQIGVSSFNSDNYNGSTDVYFNNFGANKNVFGIFYKSDLQLRDFLTPRRTIVSLSGNPDNSCTMDSLPKINSQRVPFYLWKILPNSSNQFFGPYQENTNSIFGDPENNWTTLWNDNIVSLNYQELDRVGGNGGPYLMQPTDEAQNQFFKGYIFNVVDGTNNAQPPSAGGPDGPDPSNTTTIPGAPYYFYFGIYRGKTAFDRFLTKWIKTDINIIE
jgi:hypothetical protein